MGLQIYREIRSAFRNLNPERVRQLAERPLSVGLIASSHDAFTAMAGALISPGMSLARRREIARLIHRAGEGDDLTRFDLLLAEDELLGPSEAFHFSATEPHLSARRILAARNDLDLPLARHFVPFRQPVIARIIRKISRENAAFCVVTALPDMIPSLIELPWAVGEFASDTAFLTMNQVRMAFLIAAASDQEVSYHEQGPQIAAIVAGAVGWRALARELIGKIPFGGGLIPKAAIAYAGTYTVGLGLERFYRLGRGLTRAERRMAYQRALERGRDVVASIVELRRSA
jgi:hypothetical protein